MKWGNAIKNSHRKGTYGTFQCKFGHRNMELADEAPVTGGVYFLGQFHSASSHVWPRMATQMPRQSVGWVAAVGLGWVLTKRGNGHTKVPWQVIALRRAKPAKRNAAISPLSGFGGFCF